MGFGLVFELIEILHNVTICNHSAITNSHNLQFNTALQSLSGNGFNGGRSPYYGFPNYPRASATSF
jgi:hypothetical protein